MYNRYIPQPDGTFRRDLIRSKDSMRQTEMPPQPLMVASVQPCPEAPAPQHSKARKEHPKQAKPHSPPSGESITSFFRNLFPGNLDTGDLLVIILLLLMAGDCAEDQNHTLLTLLLYLFL